MKESMNEIKTEFKSKLLFWNNIQSKNAKVALILLFGWRMRKYYLVVALSKI
ncbi:MAG: hypothetical protein ACPGTQ_06720 [Colwellia sp.]